MFQSTRPRSRHHPNVTSALHLSFNLKNALPSMPMHPHCMCMLVEVYQGEINLDDRHGEQRKADNEWLDTLTDQQRVELPGNKCAAAVAKGGDWQDYMKSYKPMGEAESRINLQSSAEKSKIQINDGVSKDEMINSIMESPVFAESYKLKLVNAYTYFRDNGVEFDYHALHRVVGRTMSGRIPNYETVLNAINDGTKYIKANGEKIRYKSGVVAIVGTDNKIMTVYTRKKPDEGWLIDNESSK